MKSLEAWDLQALSLDMQTQMKAATLLTRTKNKEHKKTVDKCKKALEVRESKYPDEAEVDSEIATTMGPFRRALLRVEKEMGVKHEFYHGGAFNGNTCKTILRNRALVLEALQPMLMLGQGGVQAWVGDKTWLQKEVFRWNKFASCEELYSACRPLCKHEIAALELRAVDLGFYMPTSFPNESLNPKFHVLVCELHRFARHMAAFGISPGMTNEQVIEAYHVYLNRESRRQCAAKNEAIKNKRSVDAVNMANHPALVTGDSTKRKRHFKM